MSVREFTVQFTVSAAAVRTWQFVVTGMPFFYVPPRPALPLGKTEWLRRLAVSIDGEPLWHPGGYTIGERFGSADDPFDASNWLPPLLDLCDAVTLEQIRKNRLRPITEVLAACIEDAALTLHITREDQPVTLIEFIEARLSEDEQRANAASPSPWDFYDRGHTAYIIGEDSQTVAEWDQHYLPGGLGWLSDHPNVRHIRAEEPAATLRRCATFRAMLRHAETAAEFERAVRERHEGCEDADFEREPTIDQPIHRDIAAYWNTHADYREEWKPTA